MQNFYDYINKKIINKPTIVAKDEYQPVITNDRIGLLSNSTSINIDRARF